MKKTTAILFCVLCSTLMYAQFPSEALRYSNLEFGGSARSMSMGGAFGALGADPSSMSSNPGGIGLYKKSSYSLTPSLVIKNKETEFLNNKIDENKFNFNFNNLSALFHFNTKNESDFKGIQFGIGVNKLANFYGKMRIKGENRSVDGTILRAYFDHATRGGTTDLSVDELSRYESFGAYLAYQTDLLYDIDTTSAVFWEYDAIYGGTLQHKTVKTSGGIEEFFISMGSNYMDKLYFGATVGIQSLDYTEKNYYYEDDVADTIPYFNSLYRYDDLSTSATGVNFKLGLIYRVLPTVRIGLAYHTPTYWGNMNDSYGARMESNMTYDQASETNISDNSIGSYEYSMITPSRTIGSLAFQIKNYGMVTAEAEIVNYAGASYDSDDDLSYVNDQIENDFQTQVNYRLGTEWRLQNFYFRGGFAYYGSPYSDSDIDGSKTYFTGGLGYRSRGLGIDIGYVNSTYENQYYIYDSNFAPITDIKHTNHQIVLTTTFSL